MRRRDFVRTSAHLALAGSLAPKLLRRLTTPAPAAGAEPFGNLQKIADGVWAMVSTPLKGDRTTLSNGGLIAGKDAVLAIEGFNLPAGATWLGERSRELTGRWPTHVVLTHYHSDHANGVAGWIVGNDHPTIHTTARTRQLVLERNKPDDPARTLALNGAELLSATEPTTLDLGGRVVRIVPRRGHTESDLSLEIDDPSIVFCGDLFWNAMFPNYVDAIPTDLAAAVKAIRRDRSTTYVPGHGDVGRVGDYDRYMAMLAEVESAARSAHAAGKSPTDGAANFKLPDSLGTWFAFSPAFFTRAFEAWYRVLG